ncbi:MAG: single-stranded DNA-binding protein [Candidatus Koribacter versatilis]|uniref:Single-stranded DNA-binding protein n=1 Tax=Candidatus Korobacter versatilis TaxID=658062 RepID=A0A932A7P4_9BACT|nr:single-stranded DNA-binding protein [Candidatus Koribacter versatilis]
MPLDDKVAAAKHIDALLKRLIPAGGFQLKWRITVDPAVPENSPERPAILVELGGPDSPAVLAQNAELLRSFETVALKSLRLESEEHDLVIFDCRNYRSGRLEELTQAAGHAAERVRRTGQPYSFSPMSARERRIVHLALKAHGDLFTQSEGEGMRRYVVVSLKEEESRGNSAR